MAKNSPTSDQPERPEWFDELPPTIHLLSGSMSKEFFTDNCTKCPAGSPLAINDHTVGFHRTVCDVLSSLQEADIYRADHLRKKVLRVMGEDHGCFPVKNAEQASHYVDKIEAAEPGF